MNQKSKSRNRRRIAIACQGGGSHTAFTAGALKTILEKVRDEQRYEIVALSGTSGGAICAFLAWYALLQSDSGKEVIEEVSINKAIEALHRFWTVDNTANWKAHDPLGSGWDALTNDSLAVANLLRQFAEVVSGVGLNAELNPYRYHDISNYWRDRLKRTIEKRIKKIGQGANRQAGTPDQHPKLFVGAINTLTGEFVVFKSHKKEGDNFALNDNQENLVSVDAVLASAAIPVVFEATRTGEAVYWDPACLGNERPYRTYVKEGVYWDGLYSQNPPVRDLTDADPHEIWVIQINPEEIREEPKSTAKIEDRRNELAGNVSLNQELYFIRKINELVKQCGHWEEDYGEIARMVLRIPQPGERKNSEKKYGTIKVRRIELTQPLDVASKLDRSQLHIEGLIEDGVQQARQFLQVIPSQIAFEEAWERILRNRKPRNEKKKRKQKKYTQSLDTVMELFSERPTIELVPPVDPSSGLPQTKGWKAEKDPEKVRSVLEWCVRNNLTIEQSRDYQVSKQRPDKKVVTCWALATTDRFGEPIKGRAEIVVKNGKVQSLTVYPLSLKVMRGLRKEMEELSVKAASGSH